LSVGDIRLQIAAEWLQIAQRSQWRAYRKPPSLFRMVLSLTPYDLPFHRKWRFHGPQDTRMAISLKRVIRSTSCLVWDGGSNGAIFDSSKFKMAAAAILDNFEWPYLRNGSRSTYSTHRAVIFAIAQLSCWKDEALSSLRAVAEKKKIWRISDYISHDPLPDSYLLHCVTRVDKV